MTVVDIYNCQCCQKQQERNLLHNGLVVQPSLPPLLSFFYDLLFFHTAQKFFIYIFSVPLSFALRDRGLLFISSSVATIGFLFTKRKGLCRDVVSKGFSSSSLNVPFLKNTLT